MTNRTNCVEGDFNPCSPKAICQTCCNRRMDVRHYSYTARYRRTLVDANKECIKTKLKAKMLKSFPSDKGQWGGADLRFCSSQPDTSGSCKSMDTGPVCRVECLFSSQLMLVPIYTAW